MRNMLEMLGKKKVVWYDAGRTKVIRGETIVDEHFIKVTPTGQNTIWINKDAVVFIG
jgi:hypothetical protein